VDQWVNRAIELARMAAAINEFPVGALVVLNDQVIGEGMNQKESLGDPTAHAEVMAIRDACNRVGDWRLSGSILVTTLEPCPMCLGTILQSRVSEIVYLAKDLRWGACGSVMDFSNHSALNHRCQLTYLPNETVVGLMKIFFKDQKKR
tara:strand:+ start:37612 stop:38055 length:444 start_codon:yes stop_codon:yes gene_type:complete